jgi:hypothetical protein
MTPDAAARPGSHRLVRHTAVVALAALCLQSASSGDARARDCTTTRGGIYHVSVRNISCAAALRRIGQVRYIGFGARIARLTGWSCKTVGTYAEGATFRCSRHAQAFRWTAGG